MKHRIGDISNTYGYLYVKEDEGVYFWGIEDYDNIVGWEEIPKYLWEALVQYQRSLDGEDEKTEDPTASFTFGYLLKNVSDWDKFCDEMGLNPYLLREGLADSEDTCEVPISVLKKYGVLK